MLQVGRLRRTVAGSQESQYNKLPYVSCAPLLCENRGETDDAVWGSVRRILILGGSGAGKSTLAAELGRMTGLPVVHLHRHFWQPGWQEPPPATRRVKVAGLVAEPAWIIDGNFGDTLAARVAAADTILFLNFPTWRCFAQVLKRTLRSFGRVRPDLAAGCPERLDIAFLRYVWRYRRDDRNRHFTALSEFRGQLIMLRRPAEVRAYLRGLSSQKWASSRQTS
jgi:adenylate kinase family enzyme